MSSEWNTRGENTILSCLEDCTEKNTDFFSLDGLKTKAKVVDIYDGDSVTIVLKCFNEFKKFKCRITGIDTPELRTRNLREKKHGYAARDFLISVIKKCHDIVDVECHEFDKYGRLLITIFDTDGANVSEQMIENGFAKQYDGGTKQKWFE